MPEQHHRPWGPAPRPPMVKPLVTPIFSESTKIVGRYLYQDGKESYEPRVKPGGPAVVDEDDD